MNIIVKCRNYGQQKGDKRYEFLLRIAERLRISIKPCGGALELQQHYIATAVTKISGLL